jgi:hypothetical protein
MENNDDEILGRINNAMKNPVYRVWSIIYIDKEIEEEVLGKSWTYNDKFKTKCLYYDKKKGKILPLELKFDDMEKHEVIE